MMLAMIRRFTVSFTLSSQVAAFLSLLVWYKQNTNVKKKKAHVCYCKHWEGFISIYCKLYSTVTLRPAV